jgi:hypothetical protein
VIVLAGVALSDGDPLGVAVAVVGAFPASSPELPAYAPPPNPTAAAVSRIATTDLGEAWLDIAVHSTHRTPAVGKRVGSGFSGGRGDERHDPWADHGREGDQRRGPHNVVVADQVVDDPLEVVVVAGDDSAE